MKTDQRTLLKSWRDELKVMMRTHYLLSTRIRRLNYFLGVPAIVMTMLIASYVFFTINQDPGFWVKMLAGLIALLATILSSLQTFLKYSEQAENHRNASARYQALFNAIDQAMAFPPKDENALGEWCDKLRERWDELNLEAPTISRRLVSRAAKEIESPPAPSLPEDATEPSGQ
ncbi:MAG: SLATT domain-containing protein [Gammaproteobacteria bacterium]